MEFPWENKTTKKGDTSISNEDVERLKIKAKQWMDN